MGAPTSEDVISDGEIVVAIFLNYCDWRTAWGGRDAPRSFRFVRNIAYLVVPDIDTAIYIKANHTYIMNNCNGFGVSSLTSS